MIRTTRTIDYFVGNKLTLNDLRQIVDETDMVDGDSEVVVNVKLGQRDEPTINVFIVEA